MSTQPLTAMSTNGTSWGGGNAVSEQGQQPCHLHVPTVYSESLNLLEP